MFEQKHSNLLQRYADEFGLPTTGDEDARTWTRRLAEQFNYSFSSEGWGTKRASPTRPPSTDVICRKENNILTGYDVVISAGASNASLNLHPEPLDINDQVFIEVTPVNWLAGEVSDITLLSKSLFWGLGGLKKYPEQLNDNLFSIRADLGADCVRWFFTVGSIDGGTGQDPFSDIGAFYDWPDHFRLCVHMLDLLKSYGLKSHLTLVGAFAQADTQEKRDAIVDRAAVIINDYLDDFVCTEIWNEYEVNGAQRAWLRNMARRLRDQLPSGFPIALSSPNCVMGGNASKEEVLAEIEAMHGGDSGANTLIIHNTRPNPIWRAETLRQIGITMPIIEGEPRGPGASGGGDVRDANILGQDYLSAIRGKAKVYTLHSMEGVWGGHCDPRWNNQNEWANCFEMPNWDSISATLKSIRETGEPGGGEMPLPNRGEVFQFLQWLDWFYTAQEGLQREAGLAFLHRNNEGVIVGANADLEGVAAWGYDVYITQRVAGKSHNDAQAEVERQIKESEEWKSKHPNG